MPVRVQARTHSRASLYSGGVILQDFFRRNQKQRSPDASGRFSELQALERIEAQFAVGGWCVGAAAGALRGLYLGEDASVIGWTMAGLLAVAVAGMVGCFVGLSLRLLRKSLQKNQEDTGDPELVASLSLGTGIGSFLGALAGVLLGAWTWAPWTAAAGALLMSAAFTLFGDMVRVLMRMMALDSRAARKAGYTSDSSGQKDTGGRIRLQQQDTDNDTEPESKRPDKNARPRS